MSVNLFPNYVLRPQEIKSSSPAALVENRTPCNNTRDASIEGVIW